MNTIRKKRVVNLNRYIAVMIAITIGFTAMPGFTPKAYGGDKGVAFLGGILAGGLVSGAVHRDKVKTAAAVETANQSHTVQQVAPAPAPAPAARPTAQERIDQLDKLAAGGYITPEEYKAKKKAILDSM